LGIAVILTTTAAPAKPIPSALDPVAESYVRLVLAVGVHDADYVDAYHGPAEWRTEAVAAKKPLDAIARSAAELRTRLATIRLANGEPIIGQRLVFLDRQLAALETRVELLRGKTMSFDEESQRLYDAVAPSYADEHFAAIVAELESLVPGTGPLGERLEAFRSQFHIPPERVDAVFQAAIKEARARTLRRFPLPAGESFTVEYVTGQPWAAYNWYKGDYHSVIQVNVTRPILIDRAIDLACHEGYPGHHVANVLLEQKLFRGRGWVEFSVLPLFSPMALIAEGTGNYGIKVAFPGDERLTFLRDVLFPLAGLDPARAAEYDRIDRLASRFEGAGNEAARRFLDGRASAEATEDWLVRYTLSLPVRAKQSISFYRKYRSYVVNYGLGEQMVAAHVERRAGGDTELRWSIFGELISSPTVPSDLN
jgi:hypothetical protein